MLRYHYYVRSTFVGCGCHFYFVLAMGSEPMRCKDRLCGFRGEKLLIRYTWAELRNRSQHVRRPRHLAIIYYYINTTARSDVIVISTKTPASTAQRTVKLGADFPSHACACARSTVCGPRSAVRVRPRADDLESGSEADKNAVLNLSSRRSTL